jgi:hypothetical protein
MLWGKVRKEVKLVRQECVEIKEEIKRALWKLKEKVDIKSNMK